MQKAMPWAGFGRRLCHNKSSAPVSLRSPMPSVASRLSTSLKRRLLTTILESRHGDLREESLTRQGKGHFHVSGRGHEALATIGAQMREGDFMAPYYRDRGLCLGRGMTTAQLALEYFAKRNSSSRGRVMPSHFSSRAL